jgi:glutaredoxin
MYTTRKPIMQLKAITLPLMLALLAAGAQAQTVYRIVGPDGKVTFSDRAPDTPSKNTQTVNTSVGGTESSAAGLPYELGKVATRFPVTIFTGQNCPPCDSGRQFLISRGIPFTERTINTNQDLQALKALGSDSSLPFAKIGGQNLSGFSESEWTQYLDAAGYPKTSQLPANYRRPAATPLTQPAKAAPATAASDTSAPQETTRRLARPPAPAADPNAPNPNNPAGLKF